MTIEDLEMMLATYKNGKEKFEKVVKALVTNQNSNAQVTSVLHVLNDCDAVGDMHFIEDRANGYADIVEFKLPKVKRNTVVERNNREQFSAEINSYIAQTRVYRSYFEDPNNRRWFEKKYGFKVYKPKRYLVVGRRNDFECDEWIEIKSDYTDVEIVTYDDLVDTVVSQFYQ